VGLITSYHISIKQYRLRRDGGLVSGTLYDDATETSLPVDEPTALMSKTDGGEATDSLPAMYIYNLSRSEWANRLNLEWMYLDVVERGEEQFQILVNTIPEEPTPGYADEMKVASEALSKLIDVRNEKPLNTSEHFENPKGEMVLFRQGEELEKILKEHQGEKRLLFAGGSKKFYRNLSRLNHHVDFCTEETQRFEKVSNSIGEDGERYIRNFLGIGGNDTRIKGREARWKKRGFQLENFRIQRKIHCSIQMEIHCAKMEKPTDFLRRATRKLQTELSTFHHRVHDLRIGATIFLPHNSSLIIDKLDESSQRYDVFRSLSKCIKTLCVKKQGSKNQIDIKDFSEKKLQNTETMVLCPTSNQRVSDEEFTLFDYQFDVRNTQRSIFQILTMLYFGGVRVNLPQKYVVNFQNWFDVCPTVEHNEFKQVLNNMKGHDIKKCWEENRLATGVLCSELFECLTGEEAVQALTLSHNFNQTSDDKRLPLTLQNWPDLMIKEQERTSLEIMGGGKLPQPKQLEKLLFSSLFHLEGNGEFRFTTDPEKIKTPKAENLPGGSGQLALHTLTPDATCLQFGQDGAASIFYLIDISIGGGTSRKEKQKLKKKLRKYQPTDLGKSFITKTILVLLSSAQTPAEKIFNHSGLYPDHEQIIILNKSMMTDNQKVKFSSEKFSELLEQLMSKNIWGIQYMIHDGTTQLLSYD